MITRAAIVSDVLYRLGDVAEAVWTTPEIELFLDSGYQDIATACGVFYDWTYLENLPRGHSYSEPWERALVVAFGGFDYGYANYSADFELRMLGDERKRYGPSNHTSPFEATDGLLSRAHASTDIPATAELPKNVVDLVRVTWDKRGTEAMEPRSLSKMDARYELTKGEMFGYTWRKDGVRTLRKIRVPAQQAHTATINGSWGLLRDPADLSGDTVTGSWGVPRRIPGHHPIGPWRFGGPRRPFLDGTNVRVEHHRYGSPLDGPRAVCELPDRYAIALRDYAQAMCLRRRGPGQDVPLGDHFMQRWDRVILRIQRRMRRVDIEQISVMGGDGRPSITRPPRPKLPWNYGSVVR